MVRILLTILILLTLQSCATGLKEEVRIEQNNIDRERQNIESNRRILDSDAEVYSNGECELPAREAPPDPFCDTSQTAREHALTYCSIASGCSVALLALDDKLGSFDKKWLASESCSVGVNSLQSKGYSADMTVYNAFSAAVDVGCENEVTGFWSGLLKGASCTMALAIGIERANAYLGCLARTENSCKSAVEDWREAPFHRLEKCEDATEAISASERSIRESEEILKKKKSTLTWKLFGSE